MVLAKIGLLPLPISICIELNTRGLGVCRILLKIRLRCGQAWRPLGKCRVLRSKSMIATGLRALNGVSYKPLRRRTGREIRLQGSIRYHMINVTMLVDGSQVKKRLFENLGVQCR